MGASEKKCKTDNITYQLIEANTSREIGNIAIDFELCFWHLSKFQSNIYSPFSFSPVIANSWVHKVPFLKGSTVF